MTEPRAPRRRIHWPAAIVAGVVGLGGLLLFCCGHGPVRGFGGDVLIVVLLVSLLAAVRMGSARSRVFGVLLFAVATELFQGMGLVSRDSHWLLHLTLGSTYDPVDMLCYAVGAGVAAGCEWAWSGR